MSAGVGGIGHFYDRLCVIGQTFCEADGIAQYFPAGLGHVCPREQSGLVKLSVGKAWIGQVRLHLKMVKFPEGVCVID